MASTRNSIYEKVFTPNKNVIEKTVEKTRQYVFSSESFPHCFSCCLITFLIIGTRRETTSAKALEESTKKEDCSMTFYKIEKKIVSCFFYIIRCAVFMLQNESLNHEE
jgi:hypothetical protein